MRPFVYICSVMRTGSTLCQEALTQKPKALIFSEPRFDGKVFRLNLGLEIELNRFGIPIFTSRSLESMIEYMSKYVEQVGVKEIRNWGWEKYITVPDIRIVLTGRDPRDIYLSAYGVINRNDSWHPRFGFYPEGIFKEVYPDFLVQKKLAEKFDVFKIRYEDFCTNFNSVYPELKKFVDSPIDGVGDIGEFHKRIEAGVHEWTTHQGKVTPKSCFKWKNETNKDILREAVEFYDLMKEYNEFWGY